MLVVSGSKNIHDLLLNFLALNLWVVIHVRIQDYTHTHTGKVLIACCHCWFGYVVCKVEVDEDCLLFIEKMSRMGEMCCLENVMCCLLRVRSGSILRC